MKLPKFTASQQRVVIVMLIRYIPHREIARYLQKLAVMLGTESEEAIQLPTGMSQEEYEEIVIKRCKDYVSNKRRKPHWIIKKGRAKERDSELEYVRVELAETIGFVDEFWDVVDLKDALKLRDLMEEIYKIKYKIIQRNGVEVSMDEILANTIETD